ncbi:hypothetical protein [Actinophytocola sp. NPDC049390]|uniref:hypothetical protein n=1 Tax=Actinophytocola sp. NPDC049390 TaxID=3363894 RepID=UPI0037AAAF98
MTDTVKHVTEGRDPTPVLRQAVQSAQRKLLLGSRDLADVNEALAGLFAEMAPCYDQLAATAHASPDGAVAAVLAALRGAFGHAARGLPEPAVNCVITAATVAIRLADDVALDREYVDSGRWR